MSIKTDQLNIIRKQTMQIDSLKQSVESLKHSLKEEKYISSLYGERLDKINEVLDIDPDYTVSRIMDLLDKEKKLNDAITLAENVSFRNVFSVDNAR